MRPSSQSPGLLQSWKEIAGYLGRGVRTVQRYEADHRLPVRRVSGRSRSSVLAFKSDLDFWLQNMPPGSLEVERSAPLVSELRQSISEHANLRVKVHTLRLAHHESVLQLHTSLERMIEQMRFRQDA